MSQHSAAVDASLALDLSLAAAAVARWEADADFRQLRWSEPLRRVMGESSDSATDRVMRELLKPLMAAIKSSGPGDVLDLEQEVETTRGRRRFRAYATLYHDRLSTAPALRVAGVVSDVTEQVAQQQTIADLVDRYRLLVELSPDAVLVHQNGRVEYANPSACRFVRASSEQALLGRPITSLVAAKSRDQMFQRLAALAAPGAVSVPAQATVLADDGTTMEVEVTSVLTTWQGEPAYQVIVRDLTTQMNAEAALRYQAALVEQLSDAIVASDLDGSITSWNPAAEAIYGRRAEQAVGHPLRKVMGVDPRGRSQFEHVYVRPDGRRVHVRIAVADIRDRDNQVTGHVFVCSDLTEHRLAEQRYATVVASLHEGVLVVGRDGVIESANPAAHRLLGNASTLAGLAIDTLAFAPHGDSPSARHVIDVTQRDGTPQDTVTGFANSATDEVSRLAVTVRPLLADRAPYAAVVSFTDVTERLAAAEMLRHQATHDPLTGLGNRNLLLQCLSEALTTPRTHAVTVVFLDLDHFKLINDSLGHRSGDTVLKATSRRLRSVLRDEDVLSRLGGDEFVVVTRNIANEQEAAALARRLRAQLREPMHVNGRSLTVSVSAGVLMAWPDDAYTAEEVLRDADAAMYQAKAHGRGRHEFFDLALRNEDMRRLQLGEDLRRAVENEELWIAYQPITEARSGKLIGVEALARWEHPSLGPISPVEFIPIAEEGGFITQLGDRILKMACRQTAAWRAHCSALSNLRLSVNLSTAQLSDPALCGGVLATLADAALPPAALCLEITESMLVADPEKAVLVLRDLHEAGVHLAIDDFGTGYSSLAYLRRFPVGELKIDRSFVSSMNESQDDAAIVESISGLAHALGLRIVAEGVETQEQLDELNKLGCDYAQGYLIGRPSAAAEALQMFGRLARASDALARSTLGSSEADDQASACALQGPAR